MVPKINVNTTMKFNNPLAGIPDEELERRYEQQHAGLAEALRSGNKIRASRLQAAMSATEAELKRRGIHGGSLDRVTP